MFLLESLSFVQMTMVHTWDVSETQNQCAIFRFISSFKAFKLDLSIEFAIESLYLQVACIRFCRKMSAWSVSGVPATLYLHLSVPLCLVANVMRYLT